MLKFHAQLNIAEGSIRTRWIPSTFRTDAISEATIAQEWKEASERLGGKLFDGPLCRLESWELLDDDDDVDDDDKLRLNLSLTSYRLFVGTNFALKQHSQLRLPDDMLARPTGVSPALLSSDGYLMLGRRNGSVTYYPHRLHPFAGAIEPPDDGGEVDLFAQVRRELHEELSLERDDIADICCTGIVEDVALRQPEMMFTVRSRRSRLKIESRVDAEEHVSSWSCRATADDVSEALSGDDKSHFTPVAIAAMLLFGRLEFGEDWFTENAVRFRSDH